MQQWTVEQHVALDRLAGLMPAKALEDELALFGKRHSERAIVRQAATALIRRDLPSCAARNPAKGDGAAWTS